MSAHTTASPPTSDLFEDTGVSEFAQALGQAAFRSGAHPVRLTSVGLRFAARMAALGPQTLAVAMGGAPPAATGVLPDRRFADAAWDEHPAFFALREVYLAACAWGEAVVAAGSPGSDSQSKAALAGRFVGAALSPTNFLLTNPAALRRAADTYGASLVAGTGNFFSDLTTNGGRPRQVDDSGFVMGKTLAATPGTVVFRNDLMELIQYAPQTRTVHAVPLLAIPPWINKYYVMDLAPGRSFLEWAVQHERTVFVVSYADADASLREVTMDDYLTRGVLAAIDVVTDITGSATVDLVGLCLGGAIAAMTTAYLAQSDPARVNTLTLLNTLLDYSDPGALGMFTDERSLARLEEQMARTGFLEDDQMAGTFDALRPNDLIFNYVVSNWLLGRSPPAFDILAWNADGTRIPAHLHAFYLRSLYAENQLAEGKLELAGRRLDLADVTSDAYVVGAVNDHIVPWTASYQATRLLGGKVRYVLSNGGHIAGVVNPPSAKAWFEASDGTAQDAAQDAAQWRSSAGRHAQTWWQDWQVWAGGRAGPLVPPAVTHPAHPAIGAAPGEYVRRRHG